MTAPLTPRRLPAADVLRLGMVGLRTRPARATLSALGIAIGIAAMLAVVGIAASGQADLRRTLDALGTNLLTVEGAASGAGPTDLRLPTGTVPMIERIGPVLDAAALSRLPETLHVYRNDRVPPQQSNGIVPYAADLDLPAAIGMSMADGAWLNPASAAYPALVLGADAAARLGVRAADPAVVVYLGDVRFAVVGILAPVPLVPELDSAALLGAPVALRLFGSGDHPTAVYLRTADDQVNAVREVLAATANPAAPYLVVVSRPSDALAARLAAARTFNALLLGVGTVALLVGGIGVANTMVISVLERRGEIGLRRALGATRGQVRLQFLTESLLLATLGGLGGVALGALITTGYALSQHWPATIPAWVPVAGLAATLLVGVVAGAYPAGQAARLAPTTALGTA